ncbi:ROK family transcriptional regulator [Kutzneria buriramensis]|uniref:Putative NBD/HSP70 family sugar kinase n=1 Tax=Kutzneria buriramensis TaxID=1045776 RepID=A0A3E0H4C0_9PSEU|nr:ROK family transcriptional regulator [Kutzneria buriramensis]REH37981.1 putative NBD/HSP70 family sugar kinase [Kutzneria buriramensis]
MQRTTSTAGTVLRAVLEHGPVSRSAVARMTGLSAASLSRQTADLVRAGLLRELPEVSGPNGLGRPHVPLDLDTDRHVVAGVHVAVPHATSVVMDLRGRIVATHTEPHRGAGPEAVLRRAGGTVRSLLDTYADGATPLGVGFASGGWVDPDMGTVVEHELLGWRHVPVANLLSEATGLPVRIDGHSRALVHAEQLFGDARGSACVVLFVGNVVDTAFATDGVVHYGRRSAAGGVAHLPVAGSDYPCTCGRRGCLQASVSEWAMVGRALRRGIIDSPSFPALLAAARDGDTAALKLFRTRAELVGRAAAMLFDVLNPEVLVVVEQGVSNLPGCLDVLRAEVRARSTACERPEETVLPTSFPGAVLAIAAGAVLLDVLYTDPLGPVRRRFAPAM